MAIQSNGCNLERKEIGSSADEMFTNNERSNKTRENEKRSHKAGIENGGTEREDTKMYT